MVVESTSGVIPRPQAAPVRKVDRKPDFRNEEKYKERERQAQREKDRRSQSKSVGQKGSNLDLLL